MGIKRLSSASCTADDIRFDRRFSPKNFFLQYTVNLAGSAILCSYNCDHDLNADVINEV